MRPFEAYTWQHLLPLFFFLVAGWILIRFAQTASVRSQTRIGVCIASVILLSMLIGSVIKICRGTYDITDDLPLYLCRIIAWMLPLAMFFRNRFWLGVFYFWILAGTLQGVVTPDLAEGFPSFFYFRYWFLHAGLIVAILYAVIVFKIHIRWKDLWRAIGLAQVYLLLVHICNLLLGSNYSYTMRKPPGTSILDVMGPWPWYILAGEGLMCILFLLLMLPWLRVKRN